MVACPECDETVNGVDRRAKRRVGQIALPFTANLLSNVVGVENVVDRHIPFLV
jgi:hypothetical protein